MCISALFRHCQCHCQWHWWFLFLLRHIRVPTLDGRVLPLPWLMTHTITIIYFFKLGNVFVQTKKCICVEINFRWGSIATPLIDDRHTYNHWQSCFSHRNRITRSYEHFTDKCKYRKVWHWYYLYSFYCPVLQACSLSMQETWSQTLWLQESIKTSPIAFLW